MYTAVIHVKNLEASARILNKLDRSLTRGRDDVAVKALNAAAKLWDKNFMSEGSLSGGWRQLADRTVEERERLGFGGSHPIMIRYNQLHVLTTENLKGLRNADARWAKSDPQGGEIRVSVATRNGRMEVVAGGNKAMNQERSKNRPARPYWFVDSKVKRDVRQAGVDWTMGELRRVGAI